MRRFAFAAAVLCLCAPPGMAASFDCTKASRPVDKLICSDADLSRADSALAAAYKSAMASRSTDQDRAVLRDSQRAWLAERDAKCLGGAAVVSCLKAAYAERTVSLGGSPAPAGGHADISALNDGALSAAHPAERSEMGFPQGAFSPKGDLFAFSVSNLVSGDADQVWLYDLASRKLVAATLSPVKQKMGYNIDSFFFVGDTLYISGSTMPEGDVQEPFNRMATLAGAHDVPSIPAVPVRSGVARDTTAAAGDELADGGDKREEDGRYSVTSKNEGHGAITLSAEAKGSGHEWTIGTGTWNLSSFALDESHERVVYADNSGKLAIYDLKTRATVATIPVAVDTLLDVTDDGRLAAYVSNGPCDPAKPRARQQSVCFVKLP